MVKRDDKAIETTLGRVRDTDRKPAEPSCSYDAGDPADVHEAHYRPEMGTIIPNDERLRSDHR